MTGFGGTYLSDWFLGNWIFKSDICFHAQAPSHHCVPPPDGVSPNPSINLLELWPVAPIHLSIITAYT